MEFPQIQSDNKIILNLLPVIHHTVVYKGSINSWEYIDTIFYNEKCRIVLILQICHIQIYLGFNISYTSALII